MRLLGTPTPWACLATLVLPACLSPASPSSGETLFVGGRIYPEAEGPPVEALLVRDGRVVASGALVELESQASAGARRVDLRGGTGIPGLHDAHGHVLGLGEALESVELAGSDSYAEVVRRIAEQASEQPAGSWVTGRGWDHTLWPENAFPHHAPLSAAVPDHPVLVRRVDGHAALANAAALERAGLLDGGEPPGIEGGRVVVDADGPTGMLIDTAIGLVGRHVPASDRGDRRRRLLLAQEELLSLGLVTVHDMGVDADTVRLFEELDREGLLRLRIIAYLWGNDGLPEEVRARYPREADLDPASTVRTIGVKLMMDGALGSRGAALLEPYADAPGEKGLLRMSAAAFAELVDEVADAGLQPATHAIGDHANRIVLDTYAARAERDDAFRALRPRVEHAQVVEAADWARFEAVGAIASMQPTHATTDMRWAGERLGPERLEGAYAWRRLADVPRRLAFGSDFPVESPDPRLGLYAARTRRDTEGHPAGGWQPDQTLDGSEAVAAFTFGAARAAREEAGRGRLLSGNLCDMTVFDVDPVTCSPEDLLDARVLLTVIDGVVEFDGREP